MNAAALETRGLCKSFGALNVATDIDFRLEKGARHALIGPNGAGKTSFVNLVTGALRASAGEIQLGGVEITHLSQATCCGPRAATARLSRRHIASWKPSALPIRRCFRSTPWPMGASVWSKSPLRWA
jgi:ABC-type branched-subunit amino acid transport system ATPase component